MTLSGAPGDRASFAGGAGDDQLTIFGSGPVRATMGSGADRVILTVGGAEATVSLGSGEDTIALQAFGPSDAITAAHVTDFDTARTGDRVDLTGLLATAIGFEDGDNPFTTGHAALVRRGEDTVLLFDRDGADGAVAAQAVVVFEATRPGEFSAENFGRFDPDGAAAAAFVQPAHAV